MFGHTSYARRTQLLPLQAADISGAESGRSFGILAKRAADAGPARFGCQVDLRMKGDPNAHRQVFPAHNLGELLDQFRIPDRPQAQRFAPLGEAGRFYRKDGPAEVVARI